MDMDPQKRRVLVSCLTAYFLSIAMLYQISPFFQMYAETTCGASTDAVGLIFAALPLASFVSAFPAAELVVRYGTKAALAGGLVVLAGSTLAFGLSSSVPAWLFWRAMQGFASAPIYNAISSTLAETFYEPSEFAWVNAAQEAVANAGFAVGPMFGGLLFDSGGFFTPFLLSALLHLAFVGLTLLTPDPNDGGEGEDPLLMDYDGEEEAKPQPPITARQICRGRIVWMAVATVLIPGVYGALDPVLASHLRATLGDDVSDSAVGLLMSAPSVTSMLSCLFIPCLSQRFSASCLVVWGLLGLGVICALFAVSQPGPEEGDEPFGFPVGSSAQWVFQITLLLAMGAAGGISWTPILPDMMDVAANRIAEERQEATPDIAEVTPAVSSIFNAASACGEAMGPTAGGILVSLFGFGGTNIMFAGLLVCYAVALAVEECRPDNLSIATPPHSHHSPVMPQLHLRSPVPHSLDDSIVRHPHHPHHSHGPHVAHGAHGPQGTHGPHHPHS